MDTTESKPPFSASDFAALICAVTVLSAFLFMPWVSIQGIGASGMSLFSRAALSGADNELSALLAVDTADVIDTFASPLFLILAASIGGAIAALWGMVDRYNRRAASFVALVFGLAGFAYYLIFYMLNQQNAISVTGFAGAGFWVALLALQGLALQIFLPREVAKGRAWTARDVVQMVRENIYPYLLITPAMLLMIGVSLYPTIYSLYLSMTTVKRGKMRFIGFENFEFIFDSGDFWESLRLTLVFGITYVVLTMFFAFLLALLFNRGLAFGGFYMTLIFIPWVLSEITSGVVWRWMFYREVGVLQNLLGPFFGGETLIATGGGAMGIVVAASVWKSIAFAMLLILAGLQTIPKSVYEASAIDGAGRWETFRQVTWPLVRPTTLVTVVFLTIQAVNAIGMFLAITNGGPGRATEVLSLYMYREAIEYFDFGYGAAISVIMFGLNVVLAALYMRSMNQESALAS